jgi:prolyl 3-hydroxylase /prolyl 3,4-dihydroxylase
MKRKAGEIEEVASTKRLAPNTNGKDIHAAFRPDLFEVGTRETFQQAYKRSAPYPHAVVPSLIQDDLLRAVRREITSHIHFTLKETDIYRIHQSGDLANLSRLDAESLKHLPSLVRLRDALYSSELRDWMSAVTGAGKVSGKKTDMAVNVYTPGSYLLCHDDVIGSRRISYILYLTDPDNPWQPEWGGGLRLYPTETRTNKQGEKVQVPLAEHSLNIPPSFGQLSFFAVRPGESYHDVEEVYHGPDQDADAGRIRMAISGWFHIPQEGEDGFEEGVEQAQAQRSSLAQLKSAANEFDEPQLAYRHFDEPRLVMDSKAAKKEIDPGDDLDRDDDILTEQDLTFLLHYMTPHYLTPDMIEDFSSSFADVSVLQLEQFFNLKFAAELRSYITKIENDEEDSLPHMPKSYHPSTWKIARPPHKQRFAYLQTAEALHRDICPISRILADLIHSHAFKKWLALITGLNTKHLIRQSALARRFRRGKDYALAHPFQGETSRLEFTISLTPSDGWERAASANDDETDKKDRQTKHGNGHKRPAGGNRRGEGKGKGREEDAVQVSIPADVDVGGEEVYMAGDDDDGDAAPDPDARLPSVGKKPVHDPAVYQAGEEGDDGILFTNPASWNRFSIVLRDKNTLRFVKYVSEAAKGDRWDLKGEVEIDEAGWDVAENGDRDDEDDQNEEDEDEDEDEDDEEGDAIYDDDA